MGNTPDDAELERLLTQLLRAVSPAFAVDPTSDGAAAHPAGADATTGKAATGGAVAGGDAATGAAGAGAGIGATGSSVVGYGVEAVSLPQLSGSEARALIELVAARGIAQGELAGVLGLEKSTVSRLAAGLERKGWIKRGRDEGNQRYVRLYLTPEGSTVAARIWAAWRTRQARILAALSAEERAGLAAGLRGLMRGLAAEGLLAAAPGPAVGQPPGTDAAPVGGHPRAALGHAGGRDGAAVSEPQQQRRVGGMRNQSANW